MSLCSCQLPHRQWRGVSWVNDGSPWSMAVKLEGFCATPAQSRQVSLYNDIFVLGCIQLLLLHLL